MEGISQEDVDELRVKQGRALFGVDIKIVDDAGTELQWDGKAFGDLKIKGFWVCDSYFGEDDDATTVDTEGWFSTGDVATIDADGFMKITDRTKDVIKSGGEWISSIELENLAMGHPDVAEAAVIGVEHAKWGERPLLIVVPEPGKDIDGVALLGWFDGKVADWWIPNDVVTVEEIPHTATGKISKLTLRAQFADYRLPADS